MQTFLPFADFEQSAMSLDKKRCLKQVVEAGQIINTLEGRSRGWRHHPAVRMWVGHVGLLCEYYNVFYDVCVELHGIQFNKLSKFDIAGGSIPWWLGHDPFHYSHRCNLLRKAVTKPDLMNQLNSQGIFIEDHDIVEPYFWPLVKMVV